MSFLILATRRFLNPSTPVVMDFLVVCFTPFPLYNSTSNLFNLRDNQQNPVSVGMHQGPCE